ncbi:uncharacterized protein IL334_006318 [Kwoniella shivajii]|uniref:Major facilitator superfamily (MFS) profile domain-containing protein n=1 Tax=Kwoniella shivajii TaxID=564305 RepID=A0ABZ1D7P7_9TREE|nr:hypothetical protein IL334_006318 [Kwoniella shivajii]
MSAQPTSVTPAVLNDNHVDENLSEKGGLDKLQEELVFPEGGLDAWSSVLGSWFLVFGTFGTANAFGVFQSYYVLVKYPLQNSSSVAWIGSLQMFLLFMMGAIAGPMFDKGYFYYLVIIGACLHIISFFMISLCSQFWQTFLAQGVCAGIGMGLIFIPALGVTSQYFRRKRGLATGIVVTGSSAGGVVLPIMLNKLIAKVGFERAVQYTGCLIVACMVLGIALERPFGGVRGKKSGPKADVKGFFKEPAYVLLCVGVFFVAWGVFFPILFLQYFAELNGTSQNLTFYMVAILNGASVVGRTLPNLIADIFGPLNLLTIMCLLSSAMCFAFFGAAHSTAGLVVVAILYGAASGAFISLLSPAIFSMAKSQSEVGTRVGVAMMGLGLAALTGSPLGAAILDADGYGASIAWAGSMSAVGSILFIVATLFTARSKGHWRV